MQITGKVYKVGDNINTDIISPPQYMELPIEQAARYSMQAVAPQFAQTVQKGTILVAGQNFGSGSSRETSPLTLQYLGISAIVSQFFARIFYRNAINIGLPVLECPDVDRIAQADLLQISVEAGRIVDLTKNGQYECTKLPPHIIELIEMGGLFPYLERQQKNKK